MSQAPTLILLAPVSGQLWPLSSVPDPVFAEKMVGDGVSIDPTSEILLAPCAGIVTQLHSSHHALTITTKEGLEVLIHIGLDTVGLKGRGFVPKVENGAQVKIGDPLIAFDSDFLAQKAKSLLTQMVIANGDLVAEYLPATGLVKAGQSAALTVKLAVVGSAGQADESANILKSGPIIIPNPAGLHARPAAVLANAAKQFKADIKIVRDQEKANAKSVVAIMGLEVKQHDRIIVAAQGPDAAKALEALAPLLKSGLGESGTAAPAAAPQASPNSAVVKSSDPNILSGVGASPGLATGQIFQLRHAEMAVAEKGEGQEAEQKNFFAAIDAAQKELAVLQEQMRHRADPGKAAIFAAHQELLEDPELLGLAQNGISAGQSAAFAWQKAFQTQAATLAKLQNELLAARAGDLRDIGRRVLRHLVGQNEAPAPLPLGVILVAEDLSPSDTASLDKTKVLGFCTTGGSATSHASILARSLAIPAVAAIDVRALDLPDGTPVVLDGADGEMRLNPSPAEVERIHALQAEAARRRQEELAESAKAAITQDGHQIKVVANISGAAEAEESVSLGGEGVGLLRSEFLFLQRTEAPSEAEQRSVYSTIAKILGPTRDLVVRTLDVGGDKPLAYLPLPPEANPFLGVRGIRLNLLGKDLMMSQLKAILGAASFAPLHIMFPMVSSVEELREAKAMVEEAKKLVGVKDNVKVGIMVEVPAAAIMAEQLAKEVDFFSIGTNDLTQYTLAMDRGHPQLAKLADSLHPAVLNLIAHTVRGAHKHGKWVGVCGGLASETLAVPVLLGLGVDELSVSVGSIPSIKSTVRGLDFVQCQKLAQEVLTFLTAAEVRERLKKI